MIYEFNGMRPQIDASTFVSASATIIGNVTIGKNCFVGPGAVLRAEFSEWPILIEDASVVEDGVIIHGGPTPCKICRNVTIGHGAIVHSAQIGERANVGMGAVLSTASELGEYAVVAEGSVVKNRQVVPPRVVVGGAPAQVLRPVEARDIQSWAETNAWYVKLAAQYMDPQILQRVD